MAEVLITLVIIGIIAALTIPSVITAYKKHQTVTQLKKAYTTLSQTTNMAIKDHGPIVNWELSKESKNGETKAFVDKYMLPYLKIIKDCGYNYTGDCKFEWAYLKTPNTPNTFEDDYYKVVLNDGIAIIMQSGSGAVVVNIDINGQKGPNVYGKDIFNYAYFIEGYGDSDGKFLPNGGLGMGRAYYLESMCNKLDSKKTGRGTHCAALIMTDNWQIKDDYPW